jgi:hypothetical protein
MRLAHAKHHAVAADLIVSLRGEKTTTKPVLVSWRPERARVAIVGGTQIAIEQAPWQVVVEVSGPGGGELCGVRSSTPRILTAATACSTEQPKDRYRLKTSSCGRGRPISLSLKPKNG